MVLKRKTNKLNWQKFFANRQSALSSGVVALIVIVAGLFAFSNLSTTTTTPKTPSTTKQTQSDKTKTSSTTTKTTPQSSAPQAKLKPTLPTQHTVSQGENLWKIASSYYSDGYKWVLISQANNLSNPDKLSIGMVLTIPALQPTTSAPTTTTYPNINQNTGTLSHYTVIKGDSLWKISITYYGSGYNWYKIRDANPGKVGLLANGRPLITPGTVLTIPTG